MILPIPTVVTPCPVPFMGRIHFHVCEVVGHVFEGEMCRLNGRVVTVGACARCGQCAWDNGN